MTIQHIQQIDITRIRDAHAAEIGRLSVELMQYKLQNEGLVELLRERGIIDETGLVITVQ